MKTYLTLFVFLWSGLTFSQAPLLELNVDNLIGGFGVNSWHQVNDKLLFVYNSSEEGYEFYRTDGTRAGTEILKDIYPGSAGSLNHGENLIVPSNSMLGDYLYFTAFNPEYGYAIWRTNGDPDSTEVVFPYLEEPVLGMVSDSSQLFFITGTPPRVGPSPGIKAKRDFKVWHSDGSRAGTQKIKSGILSVESPSDLGISDGIFYFTLDEEGDDHLTLWKSDKRNSETIRIKNNLFEAGAKYQVASAAGIGRISEYGASIAYGQFWYFLAKDSSNWAGIWRTDGSEAGTQMIAQVENQLNSQNLVRIADVIEHQGKLYWMFFAENELSVWESDGSPTGTLKIFTETSPMPFGISELATRNDSITFLGPGSDPDSANTSIVQLDPVSRQFVVKDEIHYPTSFPLTFGNNTHRSIFLQNTQANWMLGLINRFSATPKIWVSDDLGFNFQEETSIEPQLPITSFKDQFYLNGFFVQEIEIGREPAIHSGAKDGFQLLRNIEQNSHSLANFADTYLCQDTMLLFTVFGGIGNRPNQTGAREIYRSDGTLSSTGPLGNNDPKSPYNPLFYTPFRGKIMFRGYTDSRGWELWETDGTADGTQLIKDLVLGFDSGAPEFFSIVGDTVFFHLQYSIEGSVWMSDGSSAGTRLIRKIDPITNPDYRRILDMQTAGKQVLLNVDFSKRGSRNEDVREIWAIDAANARVAPLDTGLIGVEFLGNTAGGFVFTNYEVGTGRELWITDGAPYNSQLLKDIRIGEFDSYPRDAFVFNNELYFTADDGVHGRELWKTDGSAGGTLLVKDIHPGPNSSIHNAEFYIWKDRLLFQSSDGQTGTEIWQTDGTTTGTQLFQDVATGSASSFPTSFLASDSLLYFSAYNPESGVELWYTDGINPANMLWDISPGKDNSNPFPMGIVNNTLLFGADPDTIGYELYVLDILKTSIHPLAGELDWNLYPNPTREQLRIETEESIVFPLELEIFNELGQLVLQEKLFNKEFSVQHLDRGIYFIRIQHRSGVFAEKFIKN